jgi:hypothetical protein
MVALVGLAGAALAAAGSFEVPLEPPDSKSGASASATQSAELNGSAGSTNPLHLEQPKPKRDQAFNVEIGGELRLKGEHVRNPDFGLEQSNDQALMQRLLIHLDVHFGSDLRAYVELGSHLTAFRAGGDGPTDEDRLDLSQAFLEVSGELGSGRAMLKAGRQQLKLGSSRLVSVREGPNVRRSFDGVQAIWNRPAVELRALFLQPVAPKPGVFDDSHQRGQKLYGVYASFTKPSPASRGTDLYLLGYERPEARFSSGVADERRYSAGMRLHGAANGFDWDLEGVYQFGSFGDANISAWTLASDVGFTLDTSIRPRFGIKANLASGDSNPSDRTLGTFNALFPKLPYFGEAGIIAPANVVDLHPSVTLEPARGITVMLGADVLWRHRRADVFYAPPLLPVSQIDGRGRYIGTLAELELEWKLTPSLELNAWVNHFFAGGSVTAAGGRDVRYVAASATWRF